MELKSIPTIMEYFWELQVLESFFGDYFGYSSKKAKNLFKKHEETREWNLIKKMILRKVEMLLVMNYRLQKRKNPFIMR